MMLRCDWRQPGVVAATVERLRRALGFLKELPRRAAALQCLQGAVLQAVVAWHAAQQQAEAAAAGAEAGSDAGRATLNSADGKRGEGARLLARLGPEARQIDTLTLTLTLARARALTLTLTLTRRRARWRRRRRTCAR